MNLIEQIKVNNTSIDGYQGTYYTESSDDVQVTIDANGKIIESIKNNGSKHISGDLIVDGSIYNKSFDEESLSFFKSSEDREWLLITKDNDGRVLGGRKIDGTVVENCNVVYPNGIPSEIKSYIENIDLTKNVTKIVNQGYLFTIENKLRLFNSLICIGDSTTQGHLFWRRKGTIGSDKYSYPTQLAKFFPEMTIENAGFSGISAEGWNKTKFSQYDFTEYGIAIIELSYNGGISNTFDTDVAPYGDNYAQYADTSMGNYCQLIKKIQNANPYIFIILVSSRAATQESKLAIKSVSENFDLPLLDLSDTSLYPINFEDADMPYSDAPGVHSSPWGYLLKANYVQLGIGRAIDEYYERAVTCVFGQNDWIWKITCDTNDVANCTIETPYVEIITCYTGILRCSVQEGVTFSGWYFGDNLLSTEKVFEFDPFAYPGLFRYQQPRAITITAKI